MNASNIFNMEFYKNFRDRVWLIIIASLSGATLLATIFTMSLAAAYSASHTDNPGTGLGLLLALVVIFDLMVAISLFLFSIVYPWHLLATDYSNRALPLMIASGVKRTTYHIIKLVATILSSLLAWVAILIIPFILIFSVYNPVFVDLIRTVIHGFQPGMLLLYIVEGIVSQFATVALLFFVVMITRGKFWGIFVYLGISMGIGMLTSLIRYSVVIPLSSHAISSFSPILYSYLAVDLISSLIIFIVFYFVGRRMIGRQDL